MMPEPVLDNIHYHLDSGEFVTPDRENGAASQQLEATRNSQAKKGL